MESNQVHVPKYLRTVLAYLHFVKILLLIHYISETALVIYSVTFVTALAAGSVSDHFSSASCPVKTTYLMNVEKVGYSHRTATQTFDDLVEYDALL